MILSQTKFSHEQVFFREAKEEDLNLIENSWIKSYRASLQATKCFDDIYFPEQTKIIRNLIDHNNPVVLCFADNPEVVLGFIIFNKAGNNIIVDWIGVKKTFRRLGICNFIIENILSLYQETEDIFFTHWPAKNFEFIVANQFHKHRVKFNPYLQTRFMQENL